MVMPKRESKILEDSHRRTDRLKEVAEVILPGEEVKVERRAFDTIYVGEIREGVSPIMIRPLWDNEVVVNDSEYIDAGKRLAAAYRKAEGFLVFPRWKVVRKDYS